MSVRRFLSLGVIGLGVAACGAVLSSQPARFNGHEDLVLDVVSSPEGTTLASVSEDRTIRLWDVPPGRERAVIRGIPDKVWSLAFSPDGKRIAGEAGENTLKVWDGSTGLELLSLEGHTNRIACVAFSPDGGRIASGSRDSTVRVWDVVTGKEQTCLKGHTQEVPCVAFSPDGKTLASGSGDQTVKLWDVDSGKELTTFRSHANLVRDVAFSPDGRYLASSSWDYSVRLWDLVTGETRSFDAWWLGENSGDYVTELRFSPDGKTLAGSGGDRVAVWDVASGENRANFGRGLRPFHLSLGGVLQCLDLCRGQGVLVTSLCFTSSGKLVALGKDGQTALKWELSGIGVTPSGVVWGFGYALLFLTGLACLGPISRRFPKKVASAAGPNRSAVRPPCLPRRPVVGGATYASLIAVRIGLGIALVVVILGLVYAQR